METDPHRHCNHSDEDSLLNLFHIARQEAERLKHDYIGTEHLLLSLCIVSDVLERIGLDSNEVRHETEKSLVVGTETSSTIKLPFTTQATEALEFAIEEADTTPTKSVTCEHLLVGIIRVGGISSKILSNAGMTISKARELSRIH